MFFESLLLHPTAIFRFAKFATKNFKMSHISFAMSVDLFACDNSETAEWI